MDAVNFQRANETRLIGTRPIGTRLIGTLKIDRVHLERVSLARHRWDMYAGTPSQGKASKQFWWLHTPGCQPYLKCVT